MSRGATEHSDGLSLNESRPSGRSRNKEFHNSILWRLGQPVAEHWCALARDGRCDLTSKVTAGASEMIYDESDLGDLPRPIIDERYGHQQPRGVGKRLDSLHPQSLKHGVATFSQNLVERLAHLPAKLMRLANIGADQWLRLAALRPPWPWSAPRMEAKRFPVVIPDLSADRAKAVF
jgi:hypothetical protein